MPQVFGENTGKGFSKEEPLDIFKKAIESAVLKCPVRNQDKVFLSDLWFVTSLPQDLITEVLEKFRDTFEFPEDIHVIWDDKRRKKLWERKNIPQKSEKEISEEIAKENDIIEEE